MSGQIIPSHRSGAAASIGIASARGGHGPAVNVSPSVCRTARVGQNASASSASSATPRLVALRLRRRCHGVAEGVAMIWVQARERPSAPPEAPPCGRRTRRGPGVRRPSRAAAPRPRWAARVISTAVVSRRRPLIARLPHPTGPRRDIGGARLAWGQPVAAPPAATTELERASLALAPDAPANHGALPLWMCGDRRIGWRRRGAISGLRLDTTAVEIRGAPPRPWRCRLARVYGLLAPCAVPPTTRWSPHGGAAGPLGGLDPDHRRRPRPPRDIVGGAGEATSRGVALLRARRHRRLPGPRRRPADARETFLRTCPTRALPRCDRAAAPLDERYAFDHESDANLTVCADPATLAGSAAHLIVDAATEAVRDRWTIPLLSGRRKKPRGATYGAPRAPGFSERVRWDRTWIFFGESAPCRRSSRIELPDGARSAAVAESPPGEARSSGMRAEQAAPNRGRRVRGRDRRGHGTKAGDFRASTWCAGPGHRRSHRVACSRLARAPRGFSTVAAVHVAAAQSRSG